MYEYRAYCDICKKPSNWRLTPKEAKTWRNEHFHSTHPDNPMKKVNCRIQRHTIDVDAEHRKLTDELSLERLRRMVADWRDHADYAKDAGNIHEYDGIMACVDELDALLSPANEDLSAAESTRIEEAIKEFGGSND